MCIRDRIQNPAAHRAYYDALATAKLYQTLAHYYEESMPSVFIPEPLKSPAAISLPATAKQVSFLKRLIKQKELPVEFDVEKITKSEASKLIEKILSGSIK